MLISYIAITVLCRRNRGAGGHVPPTFLEIAVVTLENNAAQKKFSLSCLPDTISFLR